MSKSIARPYARAVFSLAKSQELVGDWQQWLELTQSVARNSSFFAIVKNPRLRLDAKVKALSSILDALAKKMEKPPKKPAMFDDYLMVAIKNGRGELLADIFQLYIDFVRKDKGEALAKIEVAYQPNTQQEQDLQTLLGQYFDEKLIPEFVINQQLLGGFRATVSGKLIEVSVSDRLLKLKQNLC